MNAEMTWIAGALLLVPAAAFAALYFLLGRRIFVAAIGTAILSSAGGAFLAAAGTAMATAVDPNEAMLRGAAIGFAGGAGVAALLGILTRLLGVMRGGS